LLIECFNEIINCANLPGLPSIILAYLVYLGLKTIDGWAIKTPPKKKRTN